MKEKEPEENNSEVETDETAKDEIPVMKLQEQIAREYLEEVTELIEEMCEKESKSKIEEKVNYIFNREKLRKEKEQEEKIIKEKERLADLMRQDKELEDRQKQHDNN